MSGKPSVSERKRKLKIGVGDHVVLHLGSEDVFAEALSGASVEVWAKLTQLGRLHVDLDAADKRCRGRGSI